MVLFAGTRFALTKFILDNQATFTKLFVKNPLPLDPDDPLPDAVNSLYTHDDLEKQFNFTIEQVRLYQA